MRWQGRRESENVEDRRSSAAPVAVGGGIGAIVIAIIIALLGGDPQQFLQQANQGGGVQVGIPADGTGGGEVQLSEAEGLRGQFAKVVLADTEDVWNRIFAQQGRKYREPTLSPV